MRDKYLTYSLELSLNWIGHFNDGNGDFFSVINGTRGLFYYPREGKELLDLPKGSENKHLSPSSGFRRPMKGRRTLYFASPYHNRSLNVLAVLCPQKAGILRACLKSKSSLEFNS